MDKTNAPKTGISKVIANAMQSKTEIFIQKAKAVHGDKYDYSKTVVHGLRKENVLIVCRKHGEFSQRKDAHLSGQNCKKCTVASMSIARSSTRIDFVEKCLLVHGKRYDYSYITNDVLIDQKVKIICKSMERFYKENVFI